MTPEQAPFIRLFVNKSLAAWGIYKSVITKTVNDFNAFADLTPSAVIDKFRIKIWDKDNNDDVVYGNNFEVDETADPTTEIEGGSIIIHTGKTKSAEIEPGLISKTEHSNISVYPNPFDERLHFEFVSSVDDHACIDIFDMTGRKVKTIFNEFVVGGVNYNTEFVPQSEVSNTYLYRVTLGESVFYGKVIYKKRYVL